LSLSQGGASLALGYSLAAPSGRMLAQLVQFFKILSGESGGLLKVMPAFMPEGGAKGHGYSVESRLP
jgi:hypothetical protein